MHYCITLNGALVTFNVILLEIGIKSKWSAFIVGSHSRCSDMDHTVLPANYITSYLPLAYLISVHRIG